MEFNQSVHKFLLLFMNSKHTMKDNFKIHFPPTICNVLRQPQIPLVLLGRSNLAAL